MHAFARAVIAVAGLGHALAQPSVPRCANRSLQADPTAGCNQSTVRVETHLLTTSNSSSLPDQMIVIVQLIPDPPCYVYGAKPSAAFCEGKTLQECWTGTEVVLKNAGNISGLTFSKPRFSKPQVNCNAAPWNPCIFSDHRVHTQRLQTWDLGSGSNP